MNDQQKWDTILKWGTGVSIPLLLFVMTALWSISQTVSVNAAEMAVMQARLGSMEKTIIDIGKAANETRDAAVDMKVSQAGFQAEMKTQLSDLKEQFDSIRSAAHRRAGIK